ncbi:hypothetical protein C2G38_2112766 [Gigaspora rosea]|uniref:Protein kinase domain-containing protein n=1 Tax=Gigaspora rosea TaxID=44941 RepID=A0A397UKX8_9GLOM|nr:hypothetical protein C2G38_2112766 [Gigaspora rosea]
MQFRLVDSNLEVYGITQNTTNDEYLMVFKYANKGSLHEFLLSNFRELNWEFKLHRRNYVHGDFHSDNIL